ncbi:RNA-binding S4 domain-containing protein [Ferrimonas sp. SCSIO 43195]|nr:RNA-binding S4 domain-containing protein [Ferrimonas sp. SCSIO 43195]
MSEQLPLMPGCDFVELYKVLKIQAWVGSGSDAKLVIAEGLVEVNGQVETRKRCKLVEGDVVAFNGEQVSIGAASADARPASNDKPKVARKKPRPSIQF